MLLRNKNSFHLLTECHGSRHGARANAKKLVEQVFESFNNNLWILSSLWNCIINKNDIIM